MGVYKLRWLIASLFLAILFTIPVTAQTDAPVRLDTLNLSEFPKITTYIDVRGPNGYFVSGLPEDSATIFEDQLPIPATITETRPGAQIVVAYGGGDSFGVINLSLQSRYQVLKDWMLGWAGTQLEEGVDDLSFLVPEGVVVSHQPDPQALMEGLQNYQPDFGVNVNQVEILAAAIDMALDPIPRESMGRAVLFLTGGIADEQQSALQSQIDRAAQAGIRLHFGLINSTNFFEGNQAVRLQTAASQTDGQYFTYSSEEPLPDLNMIFEASRRNYLLEYRSQINSTGTHTIQVQISSDSGDLVSNPEQFEATISPPIPVFVSPPTEIVRTIPPDTRDAPENLVPNIQTLEVLVEFPDNYPREITKLSLYINDALTAELTEPPFEQLTFDLSPYQSDETLTIRLEATDELGLTGSGIETPVDIVIQAPQSGFFPSLGENAPLIITGVIALSGAILFLVLVIAGRIRPKRMGERRKKRKASKDPVTQPLKSRKEEETASQQNVLERITRRIPSPRIQWPSRTRPTTDPYGYLVRVEEDGEPKTESLFPITVSELTFGSDTKQAVIALNDPSVEPLHARLWRDDSGTFYLEDSGSVAGTWVNYTSAAEGGTALEHGDLIHIAKIGYRFTLSKPNKVRKPVVIPLDDNQPEDAE